MEENKKTEVNTEVKILKLKLKVEETIIEIVNLIRKSLEIITKLLNQNLI